MPKKKTNGSSNGILGPLLLLCLALVNGQSVRSREVGCDGVTGSGQREDNCGICGGDNSSCEKVTGLFIRERLGTGYVDVVEIPAGARKINVTELQRSRNYIVLIDKLTGKSIINGNWTISRTGPHRAAGAEFRYVQPPYSARGESVYAYGPLTSPVQLMILAQGKRNPGVQYSYIKMILRTWPDPNSIQSNPAAKGPTVGYRGQERVSEVRGTGSTVGQLQETPYEPPVSAKLDLTRLPPAGSSFFQDGSEVAAQEGSAITRVKIAASGLFKWKLAKPSNCTRPCGGGLSAATAVCFQSLSNIVVTDENCLGITKPSEYSVPCNTQPCPPSWELEEWSECSTTCGTGIQKRRVVCRQRVSSLHAISKPADECPDRKPAINQMCEERKCHSWSVADWSSCSAKCGDGKQRRSVKCEDYVGSRVNDSFCSHPKPSHVARCRGDCSHTWMHSAWSNKCSADCGAGYIERQVYCPADKHIFTGRSQCGARPLMNRRCATLNECGGMWFTGPWSECVGPCDEGFQTRYVYCMVRRGHWHSVSYDTDCPKELKPPTQQSCPSRACFVHPQWFISDWGDCSESCGRGFRKRAVECLDSKFRPSSECNRSAQPKSQSVCRIKECEKSLEKPQADGSRCSDTSKNCGLVKQAGLCRTYTTGCCSTCGS